MTDNKQYPPLPDFEEVEQHIYGASRRHIPQGMLEPIHDLMRAYVDADRAMRAAQAAPAAWRHSRTYSVYEAAEQVPMTEAARDVLTERQRQISVEGWTPEHDDKERLPDELALAAASYVCADEQNAPPAIWPWDWSWWKPSDRRRNLVKSGALILAEIERLDRAAARATKEGGAW